MEKDLSYRNDDFYEYMNGRLRYRKITLKDICEGIIDTDKLYKYMSQQISLTKLVKDRLLDRMGGSDYDYEYYLLPDEYKMWENRQSLVKKIFLGDCAEYGEFENADIYSLKDETDGRLPRQFALAMKVQAMKHGNSRCEEYIDTITEAIELTVPEFDGIIADIDREITDEHLFGILKQDILQNDSEHIIWDKVYTTGKRLGCQELALMLDYAEYIAEIDPEHSTEADDYKFFDNIVLALKLCISFLKYIPGEFNEHTAVLKIYPKAVCSLCKISNIYMSDIANAKAEDEAEPIKKELLIKLCTEAIEMLGPGMRTYYVWELLDYRQQYTGVQDELKTAVEYMYKLADVEVRTVDDAYLYVETEVYDAARVIDVRRRMLSMTKKDLCRNLCTEMTLLNFLNKKRNPHAYTVRALFDKLKMDTRLICSEIVSSSYEDRMNAREIKRLSARGEYERADELNEKLKKNLDMGCIENIRAIEGHSIYYRLRRGEIDEQQHRQAYTELLDMTVDAEWLEKNIISLSSGNDIFLTGDELICFYNMVRYDDKKYELDLLYHICDIYERNFSEKPNGEMHKFEDNLILNHVNRCVMIMSYAASGYGNIGEFDFSSALNYAVMRQSLVQRRMNMVIANICSMWWNKGEQYGYDKNDEEEKRKLEYSILLYHWLKKYNLEEAYKKTYNKRYK